jgi:phospholipid N-methyltransferase
MKTITNDKQHGTNSMLTVAILTPLGLLGAYAAYHFGFKNKKGSTPAVTPGSNMTTKGQQTIVQQQVINQAVVDTINSGPNGGTALTPAQQAQIASYLDASTANYNPEFATTLTQQFQAQNLAQEKKIDTSGGVVDTSLIPSSGLPDALVSFDTAAQIIPGPTLLSQ